MAQGFCAGVELLGSKRALRGLLTLAWRDVAMSMVLADRDIGRDVARGSGRGSGLSARREVRRREWRRRIERFRASGISIVAFCARENVSVASYYYWTRLLREEVSGQLNDRMDSTGSAMTGGKNLSSRRMQSPTRGTNLTPTTGVVKSFCFRPVPRSWCQPNRSI